MHQDDINNSNVIKNEPSTLQNNIAIKIDNLSFSWGKEVDQTSVNDKTDKKIENKKPKQVSNKKVAPLDEKTHKENKKSNSFEKKNLLENEEIKDQDSSLFVKDRTNRKNLINDTISTNQNITDIKDMIEEFRDESQEMRKILKNIKLDIKKGELIAIVGEVGAGKSSLLQAILNNMIVINENNPQLENGNNSHSIDNDIPNNNDNSGKIIINGEISYISQISWIENDTVKNNILFNTPYEADKYNKVLEYSELNPDLEMLVGGDMTEIGEKGINLSGGQKARVSIARGLYADKDIYIFDDPISALDAHVGEKIMKNCIMDYLKHKTRILVTHAIQYLKFVDRIIILKEGSIIWDGCYEDLIKQGFYSEMTIKLAQQNKSEAENQEELQLNLKNSKSLIEDDLEVLITNSKRNSEAGDTKEDLKFDKDQDENNKEELVQQNEKPIEDIILLKDGIDEDKRSTNGFSNKVFKNDNCIKNNVQEPTKATTKEIKRITKDEDKEIGSVKWSVYFSYINMMGGTCAFLLLMFTVLIWQSARLFSDWYLTYWTQHQKKETNFDFYWKYGTISIGTCIFVSIRMLILSRGSIRTSRILHDKMITNLVRAPINLYHDTIPKGQILNRISKDLGALDTYTMFLYGNALVYLFCFFGAIAICSIMNIWCLIFLPFILLIGLFINRFYMSCSRDLSRLDSIIRSPIINLVSATIPGATTIRAFRYEEIYKNKFYERVDEYYKVRLFVNGAANWFGMSIDILSILFLCFLIIFLVLSREKFNPESTGLMLTYYVVLQDNIFRFLSFTTYFENSMVSLERCLKYLTIPQEKPQITEEDKNLENWPREGKINFKKFSVKYRPENEVVLKNLTFEIKPREKVGVVGRTGSGKSTLCLCLFRILEPLSGNILIDDVDITQVGLKLLRKSITIIPQVNYSYFEQLKEKSRFIYFFMI